MDSFLSAILAFPTVVFTVGVAFFVVYVLATLVGALDLEWLDGLLHIHHAEDTVLEGALSWLGVAGVPLTIFGGVSSIFAWVTSIAATKFLPDAFLVQLAILLSSGVAGLLLGGLAVRPLRGLFNVTTGPNRKAIVGKICMVRSLRVDATSGTAEVADGGSGFIAEVRCFRENELTRGSTAIIYAYDHEHGLYHVGPIDPSIAAVVDLDGRAQPGIDRPVTTTDIA